jgi:hypothetical protein
MTCGSAEAILENMLNRMKRLTLLAALFLWAGQTPGGETQATV